MIAPASELHSRFGVALDAGDEPLEALAMRIAKAVTAGKVVRVRGLDLDERSQLELTELLGTIVGTRDNGVGPLVPNVRYESGGDRFADRWHADQSWATTDAWSLLFCAEADPKADPTLFVDTASALKTFDQALIDRIGERSVVHDLTESRRLRPAAAEHESREILRHRLVRRMRRHLLRRAPKTFGDRSVNGSAVLEPIQGERKGTRYPLIDICSRSAQSHLRVGDHAWSISGLDSSESQKLLDDLHAELERPANVFRHQWRRGDLVVFDNRFVLHRREGLVDTTPGRVLRRTLAVPAT